MSTTTAKPNSVKSRARNSKETKFCKKCHQDILSNEKRDMMMSHDTYHQLQAKEYCKEHEFTYTNHKCKPKWCKKCRFLICYEIQVLSTYE